MHSITNIVQYTRYVSSKGQQACSGLFGALPNGKLS